MVEPVAPPPPDDVLELRRVIDEELDRLPEKYRLPIVLCELEGRTLDEAARLLGWPRGTVAGRLSRGRDLLRRRLARRDRCLPLFFGLLSPAVPDPLVELTLAAAGGLRLAPKVLTLAGAVLREGGRRRLARLLTLLLAVGLAGALAYQAASAALAPEPTQTPAPAPCCTHHVER